MISTLRPVIPLGAYAAGMCWRLFLSEVIS